MIYLITGASKGIGLELVFRSLKEGHSVVAVARKTSQDLEKLQNEYGEKLSVLNVDLLSPEATKEIKKQIKDYNQVDVVINNAGVYLDDDQIENFELSFKTNSIMPLFVFRAVKEKLQKSGSPKLINITSLMGSISDNSSGGSYSYRASKAALNMINKSLSIDEDWLTTVVVHPGWVQTDMGGPNAPTSKEDSVSGIKKIIDKISIKDSGNFFDFEGDELPW